MEEKNPTSSNLLLKKMRKSTNLQNKEDKLILKRLEFKANKYSSIQFGVMNTKKS